MRQLRPHANRIRDAAPFLIIWREATVHLNKVRPCSETFATVLCLLVHQTIREVLSASDDAVTARPAR